MIIECINCDKKFSVDSELIPNEGRTIQCGSCNHVWFFNNKKKKIDLLENQDHKEEVIKNKKIESKPKSKFRDKKTNNQNNKGSEIVKYSHKPSFTFTKFLSFLIVIIISFIGLIIILDTFKPFFYDLFPDLEFILFNLFEVLKDIELFIKDLAK